MANVILFCEGEKGSLDTSVLNKLIEQTGKIITLVPVGGKFNSTAFVDGYLRRGSGGVLEPNSATYFLRDRDFDFPVGVLPQLIEVRRNGGIDHNVSIYASHRTTLENYLINAQLLQEYVEGMVNPQQVDIQELMDEAARSILHYSIVRHALGYIRRRISLSTTWVPQGSGTLPDSAILASLEMCIMKAKEMISTYHSGSALVSEAYLEQSVNSFLTQFATHQFWQEQEYLIYFHGKDLQKAITIQLMNMGIQFSWNKYYRFAIDRIEFSQFPDYNQLMQLLIEVLPYFRTVVIM